MEKSYYFDGDFRREPKTDFFCVVCQKDLKSAKGYIMLGTADICESRHPDALRGDELKVPVGSECIKKIPKEYIVEDSEEQQTLTFSAKTFWKVNSPSLRKESVPGLHPLAYGATYNELTSKEKAKVRAFIKSVRE